MIIIGISAFKKCGHYNEKGYKLVVEYLDIL